jgi:hypothetical protein
MSDPLDIIADVLGSKSEATRILEKLRDAGWEVELRSIANDEIEITPTMLRAGLSAFLRDGDYTWEDRVKEIYRAIERRKRAT